MTENELKFKMSLKNIKDCRNPWATTKGDWCRKCTKWFPKGTYLFSHGGQNQWHCLECAESLKIVCDCGEYKKPPFPMCFHCNEKMHPKNGEKKEEKEEKKKYENEYEKELEEFEDELSAEKEEEAKNNEETSEEQVETVVKTCTSIDCPERTGGVCNAHSKIPLNVVFDVDDTLWKIREDRKGQCPDYDMISVLKWFVNNGNNVYVWSAGGIDYTNQIVWKLGLDHCVTVIPKGKLNERHPDNPPMDISFDDCEVNLARVDVRVKRPDYNLKIEHAIPLKGK